MLILHAWLALTGPRRTLAGELPAALPAPPGLRIAMVGGGHPIFCKTGLAIEWH